MCAQQPSQQYSSHSKGLSVVSRSVRTQWPLTHFSSAQQGTPQLGGCSKKSCSCPQLALLRIPKHALNDQVCNSSMFPERAFVIDRNIPFKEYTLTCIFLFG